jgi:SAM-dependent methyltransferase
MSTDAGFESYATIADLYDYVGLYRDRPDVRFFVDEAASAGGPILELGCGTGRVLIPTARAGLTVVGLDGSPHMLRVCRERLDAEPTAVRDRVRLVEADMRAFDLGGERFTLVTVPFRPFQHLVTVDDQLACLSCIREHLVDDGTLILDLFNPSLDLLVNRPLGELYGEEPAFSTPDGRCVVRRHRIVRHDRFNQITDGELVYDVTHPDGRRETVTHAFRTRYVFRFEAEHLLARAGFRVDAIYADYDRRPYGSTYPGELVIVARKGVR